MKFDHLRCIAEVSSQLLLVWEHNHRDRECVYHKGEHYSVSCETITTVPAWKEVAWYVSLGDIVPHNAIVKKDAVNVIIIIIINHFVRLTSQYRTLKGHHHNHKLFWLLVYAANKGTLANSTNLHVFCRKFHIASANINWQWEPEILHKRKAKDEISSDTSKTWNATAKCTW